MKEALENQRHARGFARVDKPQKNPEPWLIFANLKSSEILVIVLQSLDYLEGCRKRVIRRLGFHERAAYYVFSIQMSVMIFLSVQIVVKLNL